ncbi:MAG: 1,3-beta-galactosyl-N-acetylhexosamine phosphorylase [Enterocloster aldenensis]
MSKTKGRVTLPSESNFLDETKELLERWGADAIRDSDGTKLDRDIKSLDAKIYTTYFVARGHNEFAREHMDECQQLYLMSKRHTAVGTRLGIDFMDGYFDQQVVPDLDHDPKKWWEVMDRTTGQALPPGEWDLSMEGNPSAPGGRAGEGGKLTVVIPHAEPFHEYTVSFLVYAIWDPTQMYNHITNDWGDKPHEIPFDVRQAASGAFAKEYLVQWLKDNPDTDVVRFTTFFYHFTLVFDSDAKEKFVDWFGYGATVSVKALEEFEKEYGYALRPEDIVDNGYYNSTFRVPTRQYRDYMDFIQRFVSEKAGELVGLVHEAGREAMMFLGDNWIGTEPYGRYFPAIGLDAVVGSVGGGATLRLISDIPGVKYTEGRFLPYFFPDTFYQGNDPVPEAVENWLCARRALMRRPVDRIGYGGYLSLAYRFPGFVDYIEKVTDEFRELYDNIAGSRPYCGLKVAVLNCWGRLRSWQPYMVAHALWYKQTYTYFGILEALSGAGVDVSFISFEDIRQHGIPEDLDVIINAGDAGTAWSGGDEWLDETLVTAIRRWVYSGGGFVGVGEPCAVHHNGRFFQLADVLGVDKELGYTLSTDKYDTKQAQGHFITEDMEVNPVDGHGVLPPIDFGESMKNVYALGGDTEIVEYSDHEVHLSAHGYGKGRGVYIAGLPYSYVNTRILLRSMYYAAAREGDMKKWYADNIYCEVHAYPETGKYAVVNNSSKTQVSTVYDGQGNGTGMELKPCEIRWFSM